MNHDYLKVTYNNLKNLAELNLSFLNIKTIDKDAFKGPI